DSKCFRTDTQFAGKGYNISKAYTHRIAYGDGFIEPTDPPYTMCVAAVAEAIITAINLYVSETGGKKPYSYLPAIGWNRMRPMEIRALIWVDTKLDSYGTADALVTFGVGKRVRFSEMTPGSFINLNRNRPGRRPSGHAVIFLNFIDAEGNELKSYGDKVAGFKYWSSQGVGNQGDAGFAYRYAFLNKANEQGFCPNLGPGKPIDCWIINSRSQKLLTTGYMFHPKKWDSAARDRNIQAILEGLYVQTRSRGPTFMGLPSDISF